MDEKLYDEFKEWVRLKKSEGYDEQDIKIVLREWIDYIAYRDW